MHVIRIVLVMLAASHADAQVDLVDIADNPPSFWKKAATARYIAHNTEWAVLGTISTMPQISGHPFTNTKSFCDGPTDNSTGVPYFYSISEDASMKDIVEHPYVSMTMSEAMTAYCSSQKWDPQDPRCARLTLTGRMVKLDPGPEKDFALKSLFARHPEMKSWSWPHRFYPTKLEIEMVWLIDYFGKANIVPLEDYFTVDI